MCWDWSRETAIPMAGRNEGRRYLQMIQPKEEVVYRVKVSMIKGMDMWGKMTD